MATTTTRKARKATAKAKAAAKAPATAVKAAPVKAAPVKRWRGADYPGAVKAARLDATNAGLSAAALASIARAVSAAPLARQALIELVGTLADLRALAIDHATDRVGTVQSLGLSDAPSAGAIDDVYPVALFDTLAGRSSGTIRSTTAAAVERQTLLATIC